jgi:hypothetical protein
VHWLSGDHRPEGIYVMAGAGIRPEDGPEISLADFAAQIASAVGLEPDDEWSRAAAAVPVGVYSQEQERQVEERLRGLGYLE